MANKTEKNLDFGSLFSEKKINKLFDDLNEFVNPEEYISKYGGIKKLNKLMTDDCIFGAFETRFDAAISLNKSFDGPNEDVNDFIKQAIGKDCLDEIMMGALKSVQYGFNITELVYEELEDSSIVISEALNKSLEYYKLDRKGNIFMSDDFNAKFPAPYAKYVLSRHRADYDHPYGCSILARLYFAYEFRCHGWEFYVRFLEKFGHPIMVAKLDAKIVDQATQTTNLDQLAQILDSDGRPTAVVLDKESEFEIFNPPAGGTAFKDFVSDVNKRIYITVLGQTLTSSNDGGGSNALGQVHNLVREDKRRSDIRLIEAAVNKVIKYLGFLNDIDEEQLPEFRLEDEKSLSNDRAERDNKLNAMGVQFTDKYLIEHYDLSKDDFTIMEPTNSLPGRFTHTCNNKFASTPDQRALEALAKEASDESQEVLDLDELSVIIKTSKSKKDLEEKLTTVIGSKEASFTDMLTDALFQARVQGFVDGDKDVKDAKAKKA